MTSDEREEKYEIGNRQQTWRFRSGRKTSLLHKKRSYRQKNSLLKSLKIKDRFFFQKTEKKQSFEKLIF